MGSNTPDRASSPTHPAVSAATCSGLTRCANSTFLPELTPQNTENGRARRLQRLLNPAQINFTDRFLNSCETAHWMPATSSIRVQSPLSGAISSAAVQADQSKKIACFFSAITKDYDTAWGLVMSRSCRTITREKACCRMRQQALTAPSLVFDRKC